MKTYPCMVPQIFQFSRTIRLQPTAVMQTVGTYRRLPGVCHGVSHGRPHVRLHTGEICHVQTGRVQLRVGWQKEPAHCLCRAQEAIFRLCSLLRAQACIGCEERCTHVLAGRSSQSMASAWAQKALLGPESSCCREEAEQGLCMDTDVLT